MDIAELEAYPPMRLLMEENARLTAIIYSIFKRHPDAEGWSLVLDDVDQDIPPDPLVIGWNTIGNSAIITLVFGTTRDAMIAAGEANDSKTE
jgi:hypothetical protein